MRCQPNQPSLVPLWIMIKKHVTICINHQKVRIPATMSASLSVSPTFSPRDFAHILHHLRKERFKTHYLLFSPFHRIQYWSDHCEECFIEHCSIVHISIKTELFG